MLRIFPSYYLKAELQYNIINMQSKWLRISRNGFIMFTKCPRWQISILIFWFVEKLYLYNIKNGSRLIWIVQPLLSQG